MRASSATDFKVTVEGLGDFMFGQRAMRDETKIQAEYRRITEGLEEPGPFLHLVGTWMSTLKVLMVSAPDTKWSSIDELDPLDDDVYAQLARVYTALREKEGSFRRKPSPGSAADGQAHVAVSGVPVPPTVRPGAD